MPLPKFIEINSSDLLNKKEIASKLGIKLRTVNLWMDNGHLVYFKIGKLVKFRWDDVMKHLEETCKVERGK